MREEGDEGSEHKLKERREGGREAPAMHMPVVQQGGRGGERRGEVQDEEEEWKI